MRRRSALNRELYSFMMQYNTVQYIYNTIVGGGNAMRLATK
jgi:hypothetical protein